MTHHPLTQDMLEAILEWRGVETPCTKCHGAGVRVYSSTATWRGGIGGQAMTRDVCDHCWGSGDEHEHWADLRAMRNSENERIHKEALELFARRVGIGMSSMHPAIEVLCKVLDKESKRRKPPTGDGWWDHYYWHIITTGLAKMLREAMAEKEAKP